MSKRIFISVGMHSRSNHEVALDIDRAYRKLKEMYNHDIITIVSNLYCEAPVDADRLYYLGEAIKKLGTCDACYFVKGWDNSKGCLIEATVCKLYEIPMIEEI